MSLQSRRVALIRNTTPDILEALFEMQNRVCDLCGRPIQALILAALDHSTPVIHFARSDMPIADAMAQANASKNLRCAHSSCNSRKHNKTREEWFARGLNENDQPRLFTNDELQGLRVRMSERGRKGGRVSGRQNAKSGHCARIAAAGGRRNHELHPEQSIAIGRRNVENGHMDRIRALPQTREAMRRTGRVLGLRFGSVMAESGHCARIAHLGGRANAERGAGIFAMTPKQRAAASQKGGRIGGRTNVKSGHLQSISALGGQAHVRSGHLQAITAMGGRIGAPIVNHNRWHIKRGIFNPVCALCRATTPLAK